jgi:protocatechuate 3,4-dioxygenase beta subunit
MFDLDDDDAPVGRVLSRREALTLLGGAGAAGFFALAGCGSAAAMAATADSTSSGNSNNSSSSASCVARPALTEGPYFVDEKLNRSDVRADTISGAVKAGALFALTFNVGRLQSNACAALAGVQVDVWHCDASGVYSDATDPGFNTKGQNWLRGYQITDASGTAKFTTIFPGWYSGRATHIHFKIRGTNASRAAYDFTSQLFFGEAFLSAAYAQAPYSSRNDAGRLRNASDGIYNQGGSQLLLTPAVANEGYAGAISVGLSL